MFLNINEKRDTIYGYSMSTNDSMFTVLNIKGNDTTVRSVNIPPEHKWAGMELTTDGRFMVIANACKRPKNERISGDSKKNEFVRMMAIDLNNSEKIKTVCSKDFTKGNFSAVQFMRKIKGYDYFVVACKGSLAVIHLKSKDSITMVSGRTGLSGSKSLSNRGGGGDMEFIVLKFFENIYNSYIFEVAIFGDWMIPVTIGGNNEMIKMIRLGENGNGSSLNNVAKHQFVQSFGNLGGIEKQINITENNLGYSKLQKLLFSEPVIKQLEAPKLPGFKKISISPDGRNLFYGGEAGLFVLKRQTKDSSFKLSRHDEKLSYFALRPTPSGHIVLQLNSSNDLLVIDRKLRKQIDFKGKIHDKRPVFRQPHFSFEGQKMIWFCDKYSFSIIDLRDLSQTIVSNLLPQLKENQDPEPKLAIADFIRSKVLVYYEMEGEGVLVYHEKDREPDMHLALDKFRDFSSIKAIDLTKNKFLGFAGGTGKISNQRESACLAIFSFNENLSVLVTKKFEEIPNATCINKIAMCSHNENMLIVASDGPLMLIGFDIEREEIDILKVIEMNLNGNYLIIFNYF